MMRSTIHGGCAGLTGRVRPLRILALVTDAFGGYGGIAQYNRNLLTALTSAAENIEIFVQPRIGPPTAIQVTRRIDKSKPKERPANIAKAIRDSYW